MTTTTPSGAETAPASHSSQEPKGRHSDLDVGTDSPHWRKPVYSMTEFCHLYGIARSTLFRWQRRGIAPNIRGVGRRRFVTEKDRAAWHREWFGDE